VTRAGVVAAADASRSLGLSGRAHVLVFAVCLVGALFLLRLLRRRQLRGKYTLLWIVTAFVLLAVATFPGVIDRVARSLDIYSPPNALFLLAIAFLLIVCIYFSYELTRLEERTRILAEELAILRSELPSEADGSAVADRSPSVEAGEFAGEA
jgi:hypothetical protein